MKKAREIEIPEDRNLTWDEYIDFSSHAVKSSSWYASNYVRNSNQIREKLYKKGYPKEEVTVDLPDGSTVSKNMVEDTVLRMVEMILIDDKQYATSLINSSLARGLGLSRVRSVLLEKKVDSDLAQELLETLELDDRKNEALDKAAQRVVRSSAFRRLDTGWPRQQKLTQQLAVKGFSFSDISEWREDNQELMEEEY